MWQIPPGGLSLAALLIVPAVIGWMALDLGIGAAMLVLVVPLLLAAEWIARAGGPAAAWTVAAVLFALGWACQIVGHAAFERRRPALVDNLFQMFIGPMFMTATLLVRLGWRSDLTAALQGAAAPAPRLRR